MTREMRSLPFTGLSSHLERQTQVKQNKKIRSVMGDCRQGHEININRIEVADYLNFRESLSEAGQDLSEL